MRLRPPAIVFSTLALTAGMTYAAWPQTKNGIGPMPPRKVAIAPDRTDGGNKDTGWDVAFSDISYNDKTGRNEFHKIVATSDEGTVIHADTWTGNHNDKTGRATGNLKMTDPQADATADVANVYYARAKRLLVMTGNVDILVKPKKKDQQTPTTPPAPAPVVVKDGQAKVEEPASETADDENSPSSARRHPATITCDKLEYEYARNKKHAVLTGHFKVVQKLKDNTRTLTAEHGEWFGLEDRVLLYGPVHVEDTKGSVFDFPSNVTVYVTEGDERLEGKNGHGHFVVRDDDTGDDTTASPAPTSQPAAPAKPAKPGQAGH